MKIEEIMDYVTSEYEGVVITKNWGERGLFYNPEGKLPKGVYILKIFRVRVKTNFRYLASKTLTAV